MDWKIDTGRDVTSAFRGVTTPLRELYDEIHGRGWDVSKVDIKNGVFAATCKNPHGEKVEKTGPNQQTALAHCLVAIMRQETMRFKGRTSAWEHTWEDQLPQIAKAYADAPAYDPKAAGAWKELADDSTKRAQAIAKQIRVEFTHDPHPYADVNEMADDIRQKKKIQVSKANLAHPLWSTDQMLAYRLVHDVLGHAQVGGDWGWHGENGATAAHMPLLSPQAQAALFTEAIGQTAHNHVYRHLGPQKIVFLDKYLQEAQDAENAAGHSGVHPSQSIVPTGIPSIEIEGDKTSAWGGGPEPWGWGKWGKGYIDSEGKPHIWATNEEGDPHHLDVALDSEGLGYEDFDPEEEELKDYYSNPITIAPDGEYTHANGLNDDAQPDGQEGTFANLETALRYQPDHNKWTQQHIAPGGSYGHGQHLAKVEDGKDPNDGWESGVEPLPDNAFLWQREQSGVDPLDYQGVKGAAHQINPGWFQLHHHDGTPDLDSQRQTVVNAFRSVLSQPRKSPQWGATHYQHIQHIPATVSDPLRYSDVLNAQREAHNQARGLPEGIHNQIWAPQADALKSWIKGLHPNMDETQVEEAAHRELFHMIAEEEERVSAEDPGNELTTMQIGEAVNKALRQRLNVVTKPRLDQKFDFGTERLFHEAFTAPDPGIYGDFMSSHLRPIANTSLNANQLLRAARDDVTEHGGKGHHFRAQAMNLMPGMDPKDISHAWLMLQPHTSQLAVVNPRVVNALGYKESPSTRDYFKLERQLAAGRDAAGYTHVPLGQFGWGLSDYMNYGHGQHQDLRPFAALDPTPAAQVDWNSRLDWPTTEWKEPYWWDSTSDVRDEVGKQWDRSVGVQNPQERVPFRMGAVMTRPYVTHPQSGEVIEGEPNLSLMQHAKNALGLTTEQIWAADPEVGRR